MKFLAPAVYIPSRNPIGFIVKLPQSTTAPSTPPMTVADRSAALLLG